MLCAGDIKLLVLFVVDFSQISPLPRVLRPVNADNMQRCTAFYTRAKRR